MLAVPGLTQAPIHFSVLVSRVLLEQAKAFVVDEPSLGHGHLGEGSQLLGSFGDSRIFLL